MTSPTTPSADSGSVASAAGRGNADLGLNGDRQATGGGEWGWGVWLDESDPVRLAGKPLITETAYGGIAGGKL